MNIEWINHEIVVELTTGDLPGRAATVRVGTVTTLPAGAVPAVENVGTPYDAVLNFALPAAALPAWGAITGDLSDQTDLKTALAGKASVILESAAGSNVQIPDAAEGPAVSLTVGIEPLQSGSGTPAPDNIRPLSGWDGLAIICRGEEDARTLSAGWGETAGTVYGGVLDVISGTLTVDHGSHVFDGSEAIAVYNSRIGWKLPAVLKPPAVNSAQNAIASHYPARTANELWSSRTTANYLGIGAVQSAGEGFIFIVDNVSFADKNPENYKAWLAEQYAAGTPLSVCWVLAEPLTRQLDPQVLRLFQGTNTLSADTGEISLTYRADTKLYIEKRIAALLDSLGTGV